VEHPSDGEDGDGGQLGNGRAVGRVAVVLVAMIDVSLDVIVGRVVGGLLHAPFGSSALQHVVDLALHILDHLAAIIATAAIRGNEMILVAAIL